MIAPAKQLFNESFGERFLLKKEKTRWPALYQAWKLGCLSYVDLALTEKLLRNHPDADELTAGLICHLSKCSREGHLCVRVQENAIKPSPQELWFSEEMDQDISKVEEFTKKMESSKIHIPTDLITEVEAGKVVYPITSICRMHDYYYFQKNWIFESVFLTNLRRILTSSSIDLDQTMATLRIDELIKNNLVNERQADAIQKACQNSFTIICGGPGTGKTYTAGHFIRIFWESLRDEKKETFNMVVAAPTGKAANQLLKSLQRALGDLECLQRIQAKTLHTLLRIHSSSEWLPQPSPLAEDLILVDEASMVDVRLMSQLFASVKPGARLVLLGDPYQLPPVEAGSLFSDLVSVLGERYLSELETCVRVDQPDLLNFAKAVNQGTTREAVNLLSSSAIQHHPLNTVENSPKSIQGNILKQASSCFPDPRMQDKTPEQILREFDRFRILTPFRKGFLGIEEINQKLFRMMMLKVKHNESFAVPIMIVMNDRKLDLFNGEVGILVKKGGRESSEHDQAFFPSHDGKCVRSFPVILLPKFEYAYCLSVHKSQGSEFQYVMLLLPEGSELFGREVLYTAVTRAKSKLDIWTDENTLNKTIQRQCRRMSAVCERRKLLENNIES